MTSVFITVPYKSEMAIVDGVPCTVIEMPCEPLSGEIMANLIKAMKKAWPEMSEDDIDDVVRLTDGKAAKRHLFMSMSRLVPGEHKIDRCGDDEAFELSSYFSGSREKDSSLLDDDDDENADGFYDELS